MPFEPLSERGGLFGPFPGDVAGSNRVGSRLRFALNACYNSEPVCQSRPRKCNLPPAVLRTLSSFWGPCAPLQTCRVSRTLSGPFRGWRLTSSAACMLATGHLRRHKRPRGPWRRPTAQQNHPTTTPVLDSPCLSWLHQVAGACTALPTPSATSRRGCAGQPSEPGNLPCLCTSTRQRRLCQT